MLKGLLYTHITVILKLKYYGQTQAGLHILKVEKLYVCEYKPGSILHLRSTCGEFVMVVFVTVL